MPHACFITHAPFSVCTQAHIHTGKAGANGGVAAWTYPLSATGLDLVPAISGDIRWVVGRVY